MAPLPWLTRQSLSTKAPSLKLMVISMLLPARSLLVMVKSLLMVLPLALLFPRHSSAGNTIISQGTVVVSRADRPVKVGGCLTFSGTIDLNDTVPSSDNRTIEVVPFLLSSSSLDSHRKVFEYSCSDTDFDDVTLTGNLPAHCYIANPSPIYFSVSLDDKPECNRDPTMQHASGTTLILPLPLSPHSAGSSSSPLCLGIFVILLTLLTISF